MEYYIFSRRLYLIGLSWEDLKIYIWFLLNDVPNFYPFRMLSSWITLSVCHRMLLLILIEGCYIFWLCYDGMMVQSFISSSSLFAQQPLVGPTWPSSEALPIRLCRGQPS